MVLWYQSVGEGGITLTSAPVATRKWVPEAKSWIKHRQLDGRPRWLVAASDWPGCFPTWSKVVNTCGHITKPKVIPAEVGRSAGLEVREWLEECDE